MSTRKRIVVIPDTQVKPGVRTDHLGWIGEYIASKKPDVVVHLGDHWDMPSLSSYDRGKRAAENRRVSSDIEAGNKALSLLTERIRSSGLNPRLVMLRGNHEQRLDRYTEDHPELAGSVGDHLFNDRNLGWEVHDFLKPVTISGVTFCHYFPRGSDGTVGQTKRGAPSARAQILREMRTTVSGHRQGLDVAIHNTGARTIRGIIAGSCLAPHHQVLMADLRYKPLGDLKVGEQVVGFDENSGMDGIRSRRYQTGTVEALRLDQAELFRVTLDTGREFLVTADHLWLVRSGCSSKWLRTDQMYPTTQGRGSTHVPQLLDHWQELRTYEAGWLAGMYDGEGCLYRRTTTGGVVMQLGITQKRGPTLDRIRDLLNSELGLSSSVEINADTDVGCIRIQGGRIQIAKVLGQLRPGRLLPKFSPHLLGRLNVTDSRQHAVVSIAPAGIGDIVRLAIDTGTMIVEGYGHHNCYQHRESYLSPQGNNHWHGLVYLTEVQNGNFCFCEVSLDYLRRRYGASKKTG